MSRRLAGLFWIIALQCFPLTSAGAQDALESGLELWQQGRQPEAVRLWEPLARAGHAEAQLFLAFAHRTGRGAAPDDARAAHWYRLASEQGVPEAQMELGLMYELGIGVPVDADTAASWYSLATRGEFCPGELAAGGRLGNR